jgi:ribonucleoside-diphosphate reductase alpha chain
MALIHQSGGGTGFSFSRLRAKGAMVRSTTGVASGPGELHEALRREHRRGEAGRHAARREHGHPARRPPRRARASSLQGRPHAGHELQHLGGITEQFMEALKAGASYDLSTRRRAGDGQLDARSVWDKMVLGAWRTGEPGVFFVDEANRYNPVPHLGAYEATNPCGEQPLLPYDVCNLGSVNVGYYVRDGQIDWEAFGATSARRRTSSTTSSTSTSTRCRRSTRCPSASAASGSA